MTEKNQQITPKKIAKMMRNIKKMVATLPTPPYSDQFNELSLFLRDVTKTCKYDFSLKSHPDYKDFFYALCEAYRSASQLEGLLFEAENRVGRQK